MLLQFQVQQLLRDGWLKIDPYHFFNLRNGVLSLTMQKTGQILNPPDYKTFVDDPREIVINIYKDSLPFENSDVNVYKLSSGHSIIVKSNEKLTLNDQVFAIVYPSYQTSVPLEIHTSNILYPGFSDNLVFRVTNPWPYPVYLTYDKEIARVVFYSTDHAYHTGLDHLDHPASAIIFTPYGKLVTTNVQAAMQELENNKIDRERNFLTDGRTVDGFVSIVTVDEDVVAGDVLNVNEDGVYIKSKNDKDAGLTAVVAIQDIGGESSGKVLHFGYYKNSVFDFPVGSNLYLASENGKLVAEIPTESNTKIQGVGYVVAENTIFFNPSFTYVTSDLESQISDVKDQASQAEKGVEDIWNYIYTWSGSSGSSGSIPGPPGISGYSGCSGSIGPSGGESGASGYSGKRGEKGYSGYSGWSGATGPSGGPPGASGISGYSGEKGDSGGIPGASGISGYSGGKGSDGTAGASGISGYSGPQGISGISGFSGSSLTGSGNTVIFSRNGIVKANRSLEFNGIPSNTLGYPMGKSGKIKSIFINCTNATGCVLQIIGSSSGILKDNISVSGAGRTDVLGLDISFLSSDNLSCKVSAGSILKPIVVVDYIWL